MKFELNEAQMAKLHPWIAEQDAKTLANQLISDDRWERELAKDNIPYYGCCGGELTYCFTPTSIGTILVVKHSNGSELDLSDEGGFG